MVKRYIKAVTKTRFLWLARLCRNMGCFLVSSIWNLCFLGYSKVKSCLKKKNKQTKQSHNVLHTRAYSATSWRSSNCTSGCSGAVVFSSVRSAALGYSVTSTFKKQLSPRGIALTSSDWRTSHGKTAAKGGLQSRTHGWIPVRWVQGSASVRICDRNRSVTHRSVC